MKVYYEELAHNGEWRPAVYDGEPTAPSTGTTSPKRRNRTEVPPGLVGKSIDAIASWAKAKAKARKDTT